MYVTKEFSLYGHVIRNTCALRTVLLKFTRSPHVGNRVFGISRNYTHFLEQKLLATDIYRQHVQV